MRHKKLALIHTVTLSLYPHLQIEGEGLTLCIYDEAIPPSFDRV